jgi:hypothetical protein
MVESVESAINEFYKLKNKYETEILKNKKKIINNRDLSSKEKRNEYQKLKPKCINCSRPGGTIFSIKYHDAKKDIYEYRELVARCGIIAQPCNLNIRIQIGNYNSLSDNLKEIELEIKEEKNIVIDNKNKLLFGYITTETALENFESNKDYISDLTSLLEIYLNSYNDITDNTEKNEELKETIELSYDLINQIKIAINNFNVTNNHQFVRDAVNIYITNLKPLLTKIASLKYKQNTVFFNEDTNTFHLIQNKYTIKDLEYTSFKNRVVSYDVGFVKLSETRSRFIIDSDTSTEEEKRETDVSEEPEYVSESVEAIPTIVDGQVTWNNEKYQQLWNRMPLKLKDALKSDQEWIQEFMDSCVKSRENKQNCTFISPPNLIVPPNELSEGKYDFGNKLYNDFFNKQQPSYQKTLLTLYSLKNGVKNYDMLKSTINDLLAKELDFSRGFF